MKEDYNHFVVGGATGFDMLVLEELVNIKTNLKILNFKNIPIIEIAIPFHNHFDSWNIHDIIKFKELRSKVDIVTYTSDKYSENSYSIRNRYMINNSDRIIIYWDTISFGGTYNALKYSEYKQIFIENIY